ncbi:MAG: HEPN domain-containing protein [Nanoarchaeota archaeon]|nr:HEPN domain-containing protein [Nanoarchaeota archaeon]MBU1603876.1 HEPN domain-containing protein [Nanoarchaeota archaeon]MBU2443637.1 HEPN domain-containing protein [Nanoarchaeota archaeon]
MDFEYKIYLKRAQNELNLSMMIQKISDDKKIQIEIFRMKEDTYYSATISHAYYAIFYSAKAYLLLKGIKTRAPEEHKKTFEEFSKLVDKGTVDIELLKIYQNMMMKADTLLHIFEIEKSKRGKFTYQRIPQANQEPGKESIKNAQTFFNNIYRLCEEKEQKTK